MWEFLKKQYRNLYLESNKSVQIIPCIHKTINFTLLDCFFFFFFEQNDLKVTFKPMQRFHVTKLNLRGDTFQPQAKLSILQLSIEMIGFRLQNFAEQW